MSKSKNSSFFIIPKTLDLFGSLLEDDALQDIFSRMNDILPPLSLMSEEDFLDSQENLYGEPLVFEDGKGESVSRKEILTSYYRFTSLLTRYDWLVEYYPTEAAALNIRVLCMILAPLFESGKLDQLNETMMSGLVHLTLYTESLVKLKEAQPENVIM